MNLKKQVLSILLICTFAFPTSLLAQETKTHEYYVASALKLPLLSFQSPAWHDITGSTFLGISTGLIAWAIAPSFITDPTHGHQWGDLHTLTDMELLQNERMVAEYLRVRHANPDNPVIRGFRGVNGMMDELDKILTFDPKTTSFSLKGILGEKITSFDIHKILNSLQFTNDYRAFTGDTVRFQNLLGTVRNIELSFSRQMAFMLDPSAFDEANFGRLTPIIARLKDTGSVSNGATFDHILKTDAHDLMRHTNRNLNGYFWINQESRFFDQHAQRMKQLKGPYKLKVALTGIVTGLVVGGLVYYTLTSTGPHYKGTDIIQNHNLNYDDVLAMMYSEDAQDREMYKVLVESSPEFAKQMSDLREGLVQQVRHRDHTIQQFNDYVAKKNKI